MKICVCMYYDSNIKEFADINYKINERYCSKYGYDIIKSDVRIYKDRTPHWERLPLILKIISKYDYVIWIDSDAFFSNEAGPVINLIEKYKKYDLIFSSDKNYYSHINSGVFIVKNSDYSKQFLKKWAYDPNLYEYATSIKNNWHDQNALLYMLDNNVLKIKENL